MGRCWCARVLLLLFVCFVLFFFVFLGGARFRSCVLVFSYCVQTWYYATNLNSTAPTITYFFFMCTQDCVLFWLGTPSLSLTSFWLLLRKQKGPWTVTGRYFAHKVILAQSGGSLSVSFSPFCFYLFVLLSSRATGVRVDFEHRTQVRGA